MIKTQIIKENNKPIAVILDYKEYLKLREEAQDRSDYHEAVKARKNTRKLTSIEKLEKEILPGK